MRLALFALLIVPACAWADETAERAGITRFISLLNQELVKPEAAASPALLASGADASELDALINLHRHMRAVSDRPWSEVSRPKITAGAIRFVEPGVALVDASESQFGSMGTRSVPLFFVLKKDAGG